MKRALLLLPLALSFCGRPFPTPHGFSLRAPADVILESVSTKAEGGFLNVRHRTRPGCLYGKIESFLPMQPQAYFLRLNQETDLARKRPFLKDPARAVAYGRVLVARVEAYDEDAGRHLPAVVGAFSVREMLWIGWIYVRCDERALTKTAIELLEAIDVR